MSDTNEFSVEATPVVSQSDAPTVDDTSPDFDVFAQDQGSQNSQDSVDSDFGHAEHWDTEKTEVLTDLDTGSDLTAYLVNSKGARVELSHFPFRIGRDQSSALALNGPGISRSHAEIVFESGRFVIVDLGSVNGIRVNGYKVARVILENADQIKLGDASLRFTVGDQATDSDNDTPHTDEFAAVTQSSSAFEMDFKFASLLKPLGFLACAVVAVIAAIFVTDSFVKTDRVEIVNTTVSSDKAQAPQPNQPTDSNPDANAAQQDNLSKAVTQVQESSAQLTAPAAGDQQQPPTTVAAKAPVKPLAAKVSPTKPVMIPKAAFTQAKSIRSQPATVTRRVNNRNDAAALALLNRAQSQYMAGRGIQYVNDLKGVASKGQLSRDVQSSVQNKVVQLDAINYAYQEAKDNIARGQREDAVTAYLSFIELENRAGFSVKSDQRRDAEGWLALHFFKKAEEAQSNGDHHEAYRLWQKSIAMGPSTGAKVALANVDARAKRLYRKGLRLEYVNSSQAKSNWIEVVQIAPESNEYHSKSRVKLNWYDEWAP